MHIRRSFRGLVAVVLIVGLTGCAGKRMNADVDSPMRAAVDVPDHFMTSTTTGAVEPRPDEGCRSPIIDPRNGVRLTLIRSADGRGDYEPQSGASSYGLKAGELLRVECASGRPVGIVKR